MSEVGHLILDGAGLVPVAGEVADLGNAAWYFAEGDEVNGGLSLAGAVPGLGWGATGGKLIGKGARAIEGADEAAEVATQASKRVPEAGTPPQKPGAEPAGGGADKLPWTSWENYPKVARDGKEYAQIGDRLYTPHAVERMQPSGFGPRLDTLQRTGDGQGGRSVSPNLVEDVIRTGKPERDLGPAGEERLKYKSGNVEVVTEGDVVITVMTKR